MSTPRLKSYLAGEWVDGTGPGAPLHDPTTEAVLAEFSTQGLDLAAALEYGRTRGAPAMRATTFAERGAMLKALSKAIHEHRDELLALATAHYGVGQQANPRPTRCARSASRASNVATTTGWPDCSRKLNAQDT